MITGKWLKGSDDLSEAYEVRRKVFVEEQGFSPDTDRDEHDLHAQHVLLMVDGEPAGTGRMFIDEGGTFHAGRIAVLKEHRGEKLGDMLMRMILFKAESMGIKELAIGAQLPVEPFYARYGFERCGDNFFEEGCEHVPMRTNPSAGAWRGCGGCQTPCGNRTC